MLLFTHMKQRLIIALIVLGLGVAWYLGSPLFIDKTVDEALPLTQLSDEDYIDMDVEDEMPTEPIVIASGSFEDADSVHKGSGSARLYKLTDGSHIVRFEDFTVTNGPDLRVLLAMDGNTSTAVELGKLKGNMGNQNYEISADIDPSAYNSIVIYCKPFHVTFSTAELK